MSGQDSPLNGENAGQKEAEFTTDVEKPAPTATPAPTPEPTPEPVFVYTIPENALSGMEPDPEGYHESMEAAELAAFLQREEVQTLVDGRKLVWNADIERYPETPVRWYFDETILCIVWQEVEAQTVGTFSEVIIADGSQLRRKISADELWSFAFETTSQFAADTNAVLAFGGDFYYHGRACGVGFYQRELYRFEPVTCDTCYITGEGELLFSYRRQFTDQSEAEAFAKENNVLFSLGFGPVLIDDGVDVTPEEYPWGEVNDTYARSALGELEPLHYLTMNMNCAEPGTPYYNLATLRQAADAMVARGCRKAYALDGGQTATTVFGGSLINPVQFGWEKEISDIIYFASARGGERKMISP
jgi:exopolysaccharide biosynthesis protein